jgi:hypothetical protein
MGTEIVAITGMLATSAVLVLVLRQPWRAPGARLMVLWLFRGYPARHVHDGPPDARSPAQRWEDGPGPPPIGSMSAADERHYRAMTGLPPALAARPDGYPSGAELDARLEAQRAAWAEPRPAVLLLPGDGPERGPQWPPEPPGDEPGPPPPVERTDGGSVPPGGWRAQYDQLAPRPPWQPAPLPPWAADGGNWRIPPEVLPEHGLAELPDYPQVIRLGPEPEPPPLGPSFDPDGPGYEPAPPEPAMEPSELEPEAAVSWPGAMHWQPSRLASPAEQEQARELGRQDADAAEFLDRLAASNRAWLWQLRRGFLAQRGLA